MEHSKSVLQRYGRLFLACLVGLGTLSGLLLTQLFHPSFAVRGDMTATFRGAAPQAFTQIQARPLNPLLTSQQSTRLSFQDSIQSTSSVTHTLFLPSIYKSSWPGAQYTLGAQVNRVQPELAAPASAAGVRWIRLPLAWMDIEPSNTTPDHYKWSQSFDAGVAQWSAQGIKIIFTFVGNPSWAATYPGGPVDKVNKSELAEFMAAAVKHYSAPPYNVEYWEFYNEPDNGWEFYAEKGWGFFGNNPQAYVDMLATVYGPMKAADPNVQIVMGGLAYDNWGPDGPFVREFLDNVLKLGGAKYFDVMNFHYYLAFRATWEPYGKDIIGKADYLRDKLLSYGVQKPMICTESGMWTIPSQGGSDELQSRYIPQVFARAMAADLDLTIWFQMIDEGGPDDWGFGLLDADANPKPSYTAYSVLSQQLSPAKYVRTWNTSDTGSDQVEAYEFLTLKDTSRTVVAWTDDGIQHSILVSASQLTVVEKYGGQTTLYDWTDGKRDGKVKVTLGPSPVYLHLPQ
jgi:hypothetical protein